MIRRLAHLLLRLAIRIAPPVRRPWIEALWAEAEVIENDRTALRWAAGGLGAAIGWSARRDIPFVATLAAAVYSQLWVAGYALDLAMALGVPFHNAANAIDAGMQLLLASAFAAWRPRQAVLVALLVPILAWLWIVDGVLSQAQGQPIPWDFYLRCLIDFAWPPAIGAVVGVLIRRRLRRSSAI